MGLGLPRAVSSWARSLTRPSTVAFPPIVRAAPVRKVGTAIHGPYKDQVSDRKTRTQARPRIHSAPAGGSHKESPPKPSALII